jgi:hypothetical protein
VRGGREEGEQTRGIEKDERRRRVEMKEEGKG